MSKRARTVVVDASVARAAGDTETQDAGSANSRECLQAMLTAGLDLATSADTHKEWHRHKSRYSGQWLMKMYARKRVRHVEPLQQRALRQACQELSSPRRDAAEKDLHLIETALSADERIVSLDDRAQIIFAGLSGAVKVLRGVHWADARDAACVAWLQRGAPEATELQLRARTGA